MVSDREVVPRGPPVMDWRRGQEGRRLYSGRVLKSLQHLLNVPRCLLSGRLGGTQINVGHDHTVGAEPRMLQQ